MRPRTRAWLCSQFLTRQIPGISSIWLPLLQNVRKLPQKCISNTFQFADDTTLAAADSSFEIVTSILTTSFNATWEFCQSHGLIINSAKTQLIIFKAVGKRKEFSPYSGQLLYPLTDYSQTTWFDPGSTSHLWHTHRQCGQQVPWTAWNFGTSDSISS